MGQQLPNCIRLAYKVGADSPNVHVYVGIFGNFTR